MRKPRKAAGDWVCGAEVDPAFAARMDVAKRETEEILRTDPDRSIADPTLPIYRVDAANELENCRKEFESGDRMALLAAIRECARCDLPLPEWAARAYIKAYDKVLTLKVGSWDDAFGRPYPKGSHLAAMRKRRNHRYSVQLEVKRASASKPIDESLFAEVGKKLGLGKTLTAELYYGKTRSKHTASTQLPRKKKK